MAKTTDINKLNGSKLLNLFQNKIDEYEKTEEIIQDLKKVCEKYVDVQLEYSRKKSELDSIETTKEQKIKQAIDNVQKENLKYKSTYEKQSTKVNKLIPMIVSLVISLILFMSNWENLSYYTGVYGGDIIGAIIGIIIIVLIYYKHFVIAPIVLFCSILFGSFNGTLNYLILEAEMFLISYLVNKIINVVRAKKNEVIEKENEKKRKKEFQKKIETANENYEKRKIEAKKLAEEKIKKRKEELEKEISVELPKKIDESKKECLEHLNTYNKLSCIKEKLDIDNILNELYILDSKISQETIKNTQTLFGNEIDAQKVFDDLNIYDEYKNPNVLNKFIMYIQKGMCETYKECTNKYDLDKQNEEMQKRQNKEFSEMRGTIDSMNSAVSDIERQNRTIKDDIKSQMESMEYINTKVDSIQKDSFDVKLALEKDNVKREERLKKLSDADRRKEEERDERITEKAKKNIEGK